MVSWTEDETRRSRRRRNERINKQTDREGRKQKGTTKGRDATRTAGGGKGVERDGTLLRIGRLEKLKPTDLFRFHKDMSQHCLLPLGPLSCGGHILLRDTSSEIETIPEMAMGPDLGSQNTLDELFSFFV